MVALMKPIMNAKVFYEFGKQLLVDGNGPWTLYWSTPK